VRFWDLRQRKELFTLNIPSEIKKNALWDFDFRCTPTGCWMAVPLPNHRVVLYNFGRIADQLMSNGIN